MAHVSLYRKYRSQTLADVVGQEHVTTTLAAALREDKLHHAYLFTGPRGTGKTSTARILAKAVNCERGLGPEPCNECGQCVGITTGSSVDVIEIDAASHGGVDDVRELRERVAFAPASARMKVYIVDECHMLSTAGWNAFLKTVEEPPGHVLFVFATTEPHKVLPTILSRTQRFDFRRLPADKLGAHVRHIAELEGWEIEPAAVDLVVRAGDGSARDTLSVLDQVVAFTGPRVTSQGVADVLGTVGDALLGETAQRIAAGDVPGLCALVGRLSDDGHDLRQFARDLVEHLRRLFLLEAAPDAGLVEGTPEQLTDWRAQAAASGQAGLLRAIELVVDAQLDMRRGHTRLPLELALVKAAMPEAAGDASALAARLERLERAGAAAPAPAVAQTSAAATPAGRDAPAGTAPAAHEAPARDPDSDTPAADADTPAAAPEAPPEAQPAAAPDAVDPRAEGATAADPPGADADPPAADADATPDVDTSTGPPADPPPAAAAPPTSANAPGASDGLDLDEVRASWPAVLEAVKAASRRLHAFLSPGAPAALDGSTLTIAFGSSSRFHAEQCAGPEWNDTLAGALRQVLGASLTPRCVVTDEQGPVPALADEDDDQAVAVLEAEAAEAAGEAPDEEEAHHRALETLTKGLGARIVED